MNKIEESEQWLLNGDCSKCRRDSYCKKLCTKASRAADSRMAMAVHSLFDKATGGTYSKLMDMAHKNHI